jgi:hypothetical protein
MKIRGVGLIVLALAALGVLFAYYPQLSDDADIWWHLEYGRSVLRSLSWRVDHAAYSWTPADGSWVYVSWLGSLLLYGMHRLAGFAGLVAAQWLVFAGIVILYNWLLRLARLPWTALHVVILFFAGIAANPVAVYIKPELFSMLMFAATVAVFFAARLAGRLALLWIYVPLFLAWVNIHGGFVYGLAFLGLAWCGESLSCLFKSDNSLSKSAWLAFTSVLVLSACATLVNPYGWRYWPGMVENALAGGGHIRVISAYSGFTAYLAPPPFMFRKMNAGWCMLALALCLAGLLSYLRATRRKVDFTVVITNLFFFLAGFLMIRASVFFVVLWLFSVVYVMAANRFVIPGVITRIVLALAGLAAGVLVWETAALSAGRVYLGRGVNACVPAGAVEFIRRNQVPGPMFNDYITGGYLVWALYPGYKVFIDPRYGPYVKTGVWSAYARLVESGSPEALSALERSYNFQAAVVSVAHAPVVADLFLFSPRWRLVYFDPAAALFVRASLAGSRRWEGDMSPRRFERVSDPDVLARAFALYCSYNPPDAAVIRDIYAQNVSGLFVYRAKHLDWMMNTLRRLSPER